MRIIPGFSVHPLIPNNGGSRRRKPRPDGQPARMAPERIHIVTRPDARLSARAPRRGASSCRAQRARFVHGAGIRRRAARRPGAERRARQDQHRRPAAGQGAAAIRPADPAAGLFPARSGARPEGAPPSRLADRAAGAGPPAGRFRLAARIEGNTAVIAPAPAETATLSAVPVYGDGRGEAVEGLVARRSRTGTKTDTPLNEIPQTINGHRAAAGDDRRDRHQPGAALHPGFSSYGSENRSDWYSVLRGFTPTAYVDAAGAQDPEPGQLARRALHHRQHHGAARADLGAVRPGRSRRHRRRKASWPTATASARSRSRSATTRASSWRSTSATPPTATARCPTA